ncbi:MAG: dihydrofolate reductase [Arenicella sp.]
MEIILVAAIGQNRELGLDNQLLWQLPGDLPRFKEMTMGYPIIMGRKTFDSIGRPLPGRQNIVLTRNAEFSVDGLTVAHTVEQAMQLVTETNLDKVFVIGGGEIYSLFLPHATQLELTLVHDAPQADAFFPDYDSGFKETARISNQADTLHYDYVSYSRITD